MTLLALAAAVVLVSVAAYAQYRIPFHTAGRGKVLAARAVLALVGAGLGYVVSAYAQDRATAWLAFLCGFGAVHVPAAVILYVKRARSGGKS